MSEGAQAISWTIRALDPASDVPRIAALLAAVEAHDQDGEDMTEETLRARLGLPGHDPRQDQWVALAAGDAGEMIVGWGFVWKAPTDTEAYLDGAVHPAWRRRGIGNALFGRALARARELDARSAGCYAGERNAGSASFLRDRGFHPISGNTLMRAAGDMAFPPPRWPDGFAVRSYAEVRDIAVLTRAINRCYEGLWGHHVVTEEQVTEWNSEWEADGIVLAFAPDGDVAGTCRAEMSAEWSARHGVPTAYVDAPGVAPEHRAAGLYLPVLLTALAWLRSKAPAAILLESWGDSDETLALYESAGFATVRRSIAYELALAT